MMEFKNCVVILREKELRLWQDFDSYDLEHINDFVTDTGMQVEALIAVIGFDSEGNVLYDYLDGRVNSSDYPKDYYNWIRNHLFCVSAREERDNVIKLIASGDADNFRLAMQLIAGGAGSLRSFDMAVGYDVWRSRQEDASLSAIYSRVPKHLTINYSWMWEAIQNKDELADLCIGNVLSDKKVCKSEWIYPDFNFEIKNFSTLPNGLFRITFFNGSDSYVAVYECSLEEFSEELIGRIKDLTPIAKLTFTCCKDVFEKEKDTRVFLNWLEEAIHNACQKLDYHTLDFCRPYRNYPD